MLWYILFLLLSQGKFFGVKFITFFCVKKDMFEVPSLQYYLQNYFNNIDKILLKKEIWGKNVDIASFLEIFCCGPAPVAAIKTGNCKILYDLPFVFAEVNSDVIRWEYVNKMTWVNMGSDTKR